MSAKIVFNGNEYQSVEEMPAEVRAAYTAIMGIMADKNQNGLPDIIEGLPAAGQAIQAMQIFFEGKMYSDMDALPPEARARYTQAMAKMDQNQDGVIDFLQAGAPAGPRQRFAQPLAPQTIAPPTSPSAIAEDHPDRRLIFAGVLIAVLLCALAGLGAVLLMR